MGLDIVAISKAVPVECHGGDACDETHFQFCPHPNKRREGLNLGCHVVGRGGRSMGFGAGTYAGYDAWRRELCLLALGVEPEEVWEHPRRFRGKQFVELVDFPDSVGPCIGPMTSKKLYGDFAAFARRAKEYYAKPNSLRPQSSVPISTRAKGKKSRINQAGLHSAAQLANAVGGGLASVDSDDLAWMQEVYDDFRKAFRLASNGGFVMFC